MSDSTLRLSVHFGERDRVGGSLLADALLDACERHQVHTSLLLRGVEGFGLRHHLRTDRLLSLSEDLPAVVTAIDDADRIEALAESLPGPSGSGLVTLDRPLEANREGEEQARLTVFLGRRQRVAGDPAFVAVCDLLRRQGVAGATALLGVDGTVEGSRRRARFFSANADVPVLVVAVGEARSIAAAMGQLDRLLAGAGKTVEPVLVCKRDGESLAMPATEGWQRLTVISSESATVGGHAIHLALVRELRRAGARGATSVRGMWGFHGDHVPHGDRLLRLRRRAPIITTVVDEGPRIASWFEIADRLTAERGLITSEAVRVLRP